MNQSIQTINQIPITKDGITEFATRVLQAINDGEVNPLDLKIHFKALELAQERIKEHLNKLALVEAEKYKKEVYKGFLVNVQEMGQTYDYSQCNDPILVEINEEFERIKALKKGREDMLKTLKEATPMIDSKTGEQFDAYPPMKTSTTSIVLKLQ